MQSFMRIVTVNFFALGFSEIFGRALTAVATIYLARVLGVTAYGVFGFAAAIVLYFSAVIDWGIEMFGPKEVAERSNQIGELLFSTLVTRIVMSILLAGLVTVLGKFFLPSAEASVLSVYSLYLFSVALNTRWAHVGLEKTSFVAVARIIAELTKLVLILIFIRGPEDVIKVPIMLLFGETIGALLLIFWLRRYGVVVRFVVDRLIIKHMYFQATPLMFTTLLALWIENADLIYIRVFSTSRDVGIYLSAYTLINFLGLIGNTTRLTLIPTLTRLRKDKEQFNELHQTAMAFLFAFGLPMAVGIYTLAPKIIFLLFGSSYESSYIVLQILIWSFPIMLLRLVMVSILVANGKQTRVLEMTGLSAVFSIAMNLLLVPRIGMFGAAITTLITEIIRYSLGQRFVLREGLPLLKISRYWKSFVAAVFMGISLWLIRQWPIWINIPVGIVGYIFALILIGGIRFRRGELPSIAV